MGFIRRNWQQITITRRERFLRRGLLSLAIALVAATVAAKLAGLLFGILLIIASSDPGSNVVTEEVAGVVSALLAVIAAVVAIFSFVRGLALLFRSTKPSVSADSALASAQFLLGDGERELQRSSARQYGDTEDLATGYWRKPSAFTLILTNQRLAVVRVQSGQSSPTTVEDVDLRSVIDVHAETIGTFPVLPVVRVRYRGVPTGSVSQFGIRYESIEEARATADRIQALLVGG